MKNARMSISADVDGNGMSSVHYHEPVRESIIMITTDGGTVFLHCTRGGLDQLEGLVRAARMEMDLAQGAVVPDDGDGPVLGSEPVKIGS